MQRVFMLRFLVVFVGFASVVGDSAGMQMMLDDSDNRDASVQVAKRELKVEGAQDAEQLVAKVADESGNFMSLITSNLRELCHRGLPKLADRFNGEYVKLRQTKQRKCDNTESSSTMDQYSLQVQKLSENLDRLVHNPNIGDMKLISEYMQANIELLNNELERRGRKETASRNKARLEKLVADRDKEMRLFKEQRGATLSELEGLCKKHYNLLKTFYEKLFKCKS